MSDDSIYDDSSSSEEMKSPEIPATDFNLSKSELEKIIDDTTFYKYDTDCLRKHSNWSKGAKSFKFDNIHFRSDKLLEKIPRYSSKLDVLIKKIKDLDENDEKTHGHKFKHFIFSDVKSAGFGAKLVAGGLIANGMTLAYTAPLTPAGQKAMSEINYDESVYDSDDDSDDNSDDDNDDKYNYNDSDDDSHNDSDDDHYHGGSDNIRPPMKTLRMYGKIEFLDTNVLNLSKGNNFYLLSSVSVYEQPITVAMKKSILKNFNERPSNIYGDHARIIIMDSGFKEGIDLFDIKYVHIFEPQTTMADQKQVIGRGTRTCGQKGLQFHPTQGWPLHVFIYDIAVPETLKPMMLGASSAFEIYLNALGIDLRLFNFQSDLERATIIGSVDYELNQAIHSFTVEGNEVNNISSSMSVDYDQDTTSHNGGTKILVRKDLPVINLGDIMPGRTIDFDKPRFNHESMRQYIRDNFSQYAWKDIKMENLCVQKGGKSELLNYSPSQDFIRHYFTPAVPVKGMLLHHSVGTGKCHAIDTPILMYDGTIKKVQDIIVGDKLMGDDSTPRTVLSLAQGQDDMYDIVPIKGDSYRVNSQHILCLKPTRLGVRHYRNQVNRPYCAPYICTETKRVVSKSFDSMDEANAYLDEQYKKKNIMEIEVKDYLQLPNYLKKDLKGYRTGIDFPSNEVDFDPYIIGFWLGDGSKRDPVICTQDSVVLHYLMTELPKHNLSLNHQSKYDYRVSSCIKGGENIFLKALQKYNLINNKHIPHAYKINDRENRLLLLAGLIDSDGYSDRACYEITQKNKTLADDILFLCRSLGFAAYSKVCEKSCMYKGEKKTGTYYRINISGNNLDKIPVKIPRKKVSVRTQKKDALVHGINVLSVGKGDYYGFTLDGNNRYLIGDFTVTHNTCSAIAAATSSFEKQGYTILWVTRTTLKNDIWKNMFDQICHDGLREQFTNGTVIPEEQAKRMRLLSKSWSIRPMSYKQFSNLVSKENAFYHALVKKNGEADPLHKTLLIIDEAHKLYGGGDLSTIERPDMNAFQKAVQNSFLVSGNNSVRLLLMTATPITQNPMELIQIINLCKSTETQIPTNFEDFSIEYLNEYGHFTPQGELKYLDAIAGHVSYLNREKDARQFAQPIIHMIKTPIIQNEDDLERFDNRYIRLLAENDVSKLNAKIDEQNKTIDAELQDLDNSKFSFLHEKCNNYEGKEAVQCRKIVNDNIRNIIKEAKASIQTVKDNIKELREKIKQRKYVKQKKIAETQDFLNEHPRDYEEFKKTMYYQLKKCGKRVKTMDDLKNAIKTHPVIAQLDKEIAKHDAKIDELHSNLKINLDAYKNRIKRMRESAKLDLSELELNVIRSVIKDERKTLKKRANCHISTTKVLVNEHNETKKAIQKQKDKKIKKIRKTLKAHLSEIQRVEKETARTEKNMRKTQRKQGILIEKIENELIQDLVNKYSKIIDDDLESMTEDLVYVENEKRAKAAAKDAALREKEEAKKQKEIAKEEEKKQKEAAALAKSAAALEKRETKKQLQELKNAEKEARKTMKKR